MAKIIGIDLGTTNSCVAVIEGGEPTVILNAEGVRTTPSIVAYDDKGECLVGQSAKNQIITNPERTIYSIKRFMGAGYTEVKNYAEKMPYKVVDGGRKVKVKVGDVSYSPQEISARVLQKMKQSAEDYLGHEVTEAVITVPAYFNDAQRQATVDAGKIAGLDVKRIVNEPTAAALAYGLDKKKDLKIAVFDLGGGTFDISILELGDGVFEVKSTNGNTQLGGDDFDEVLIDYLSDEFKQSSGIDIKSDNMALQRLKEAAEKAKKELSTATTTDINLPFITADATGPKHLNISLTRAKFEQLIGDLVGSIRRPCEDAIKDSGFSVDEINEVILVGGSTRVPAVQAIVKEIFKREPGKGVNPDEVVALGAAIQGGILGGDVKDILLLDVTPLSLGIETLGGVMTKLIDRNSTIPAKKSQVFSTAEDNQNAVTINIFQGERSLAKDNRLLGRFDLVDIPPAPRGIPQIEVAFDIDANGILNVSAKDLGTNKENKIRIEAASGLSDSEIEEMVKKAEENKDKDRERKELIDVKNSADSTIYQTEKLLKENGDKIDGGEKKKIEEALNVLKEKQKTEVTSDIQKAIDDVMSASQEASKKLYEEAAKKGAAKKNKASSGASSSANADEKNNKKEEGVVDADYEVVDDKK